MRELDGRTYLFQEPLTADVALIRAHRADRLGNLVYRATARNFNPLMATAAGRWWPRWTRSSRWASSIPSWSPRPHLFVDHLVLARERL